MRSPWITGVGPKSNDRGPYKAQPRGMRQTEEEKTQEGKEEAVWRWGRDGRCIYKPGPPGLPATLRARRAAWVDCPSEPPGQPVPPATRFTLLASRTMKRYIYVLWSPWFCANLLLQSLETNTEWCGGRRWGRNHRQTGEHCTGPHVRRDCSTPNSGDGNGGDQEESVPQFSCLTSYIFPMCITHTKLIYWALIMCQILYTLHSLFHSHNKNRRWLLPGKKAMTKTWHRVKRQKHHFAYKGPYSQSYGLSSSHVQTRDLGNEAWVPKNWGFQTVGLEKTLASPWDCKEIKPINLNPGYSLEGLVLKLKLQYFGYLMWRADSLEKTLILWRQKEKRAMEDEMAGWHHRFNGHELGQTPRDGDGQGSLACYSPWGHKELDTIWWLDNSNNNKTMFK